MLPIASKSTPLDHPHSTPQPYLFVDLDGTLINGDSLWESFVLLIRKKPVAAVISLLSLFRGRAAFKKAVAQQIDYTPEIFHYNDDVVSFVRQEVRKGNSAVLATAADQIIANFVSNHLGCFSDIIASDGNNNLKGNHKLSAIRNYISNNSASNSFGYLGDSKSDRPIWSAATRVIVVASSTDLAQKIAGHIYVDTILKKPKASWKDYFGALRIHQWVKNTLIFVPLLLSHQFEDVEKGVMALLGFLCFGLCASATYLWNDILDLPADRRHPRKQFRPLASGKMSIRAYLAVSCLLLILSFCFSLLMLPPQATFILLGYIALTLSYSFFIKEKLLLDTMMLGLLYAYRIFYGGIVTNILVSDWLVAFSLFFFLGLALVKRYSEITAKPLNGPSNKIHGRGYYTSDREIIGVLGVSASFLSILILALYITSPTVMILYHHPQALWCVCFIMIYWVSRIWVLCHRGHMPDDPITFALRDKVSLLSGTLCLISILLAKF